MDVVYPLKRKPQNPELRYSLRSIAANLKHEQVFFAGYRPLWTKCVRYVRTAQTGSKYQNTLGNIIAACQQPDLSEDFVLMNDDFFILSPVFSVPCYHKGPMSTFLASRPNDNKYTAIIRATLDLLRSEGLAEPLLYGHHTPTVMNKHRVLEITRRFNGRPFMLRSVYHNLHGPEGTYRKDVKKHAADDRITESDFLSTSDGFSTTPHFRKLMDTLFRYPCRYETC